jgi:two-component system, OmpR family, aerobic respiration control sensor histidine kinase ArcB
LEMIKVASGAIPLVRKKFDLKEKLLHIIHLNQSKAHQKHLELTLEYDEDIPHYLIGDPTRMQRLVLELVTNALNFTDHGHVKISTQLAKRHKKHIVTKISVADTGVGISANKQQDVFTRFKRLTPSYEGIYQGAGLGLALVKQFIDDLEGEIYLESEPEKGSVFTCVVPLKEALLDEQFGADKIQIARATTELSSSKMKSVPIMAQVNSDEMGLIHILLVEDQVIAAKVTQSLLMGLDCCVDIAPDGKSALQYVKNNDYHLIFMDIGLPDMSGNEVTKQIRAWEILHDKHTPIIALTAHIDTENKESCLKAGMEAVLSKPLSKTTTLDILNALIPSRSKTAKPS